MTELRFESSEGREWFSLFFFSSLSLFLFYSSSTKDLHRPSPFPLRSSKPFLRSLKIQVHEGEINTFV